ncbi:MAG: ABC transporter ATP-binding protein [Ktedonobacterales bacterium]
MTLTPTSLPATVGHADTAAVPAIATRELGKRYGRSWALRDCTLTLPAGRVAALVGPNGAGKTTLLHLLVGLLTPSAGEALVFGQNPATQAKSVLPRIGFVAQDHPLYKGFTVADMLMMGRRLNPHWDDAIASARLRKLAIPLDRRVGKLSGGQQAQVSLALALAKRPDLLILDEPVASLDPLARRDFLRTLSSAVEEQGVTVLLSSHIIADLEQVCDYLIILAESQERLSGAIPAIQGAHRLITGPRGDAATLAGIAAHATVIEEHQTLRQTTLLARLHDEMQPPNLPMPWQITEAPLEEIVLAYLGQPLPAESPSADEEMSAPTTYTTTTEDIR